MTRVTQHPHPGEAHGPTVLGESIEQRLPTFIARTVSATWRPARSRKEPPSGCETVEPHANPTTVSPSDATYAKPRPSARNAGLGRRSQPRKARTAASSAAPSFGPSLRISTRGSLPHPWRPRQARRGYAGRITSPFGRSTTTLIDSSGVRVGPSNDSSGPTSPEPGTPGAP